MFIDWSEVTPEKAAAELPRLFERSGRAVEEIEKSDVVSWEEIQWKLDDSLTGLFRLWGIISHMTAVMDSPQWRQLKEKWQGEIVKFSLRVAQSPSLYAKNDALKKAGGLDPVRERILDRALLSARLSGVALEGGAKERFNAINMELATLSNDFSNAVLDATAAYRFEKDSKVYTIDDAAYLDTMKHCPDREVRENLFRARATRAPGNLQRIVRMLALRREKAEILGYEDYRHLSLADKCAPGVGAVSGMIDRLDEATRARAAEEESELGEGLMPWDRAFAQERLRESKFDYSDDDMKRCFKLEVVLEGLWKAAKELFGVEVVEVTGRHCVWHEDVRVFEIRQDGVTTAGFYLDAFVRNGQKRGGAWMNEFSNRCPRRGEKPLAVIVTNFTPPGKSDPDGLSLRDVETLFHEFGHALQCMLTEVDEESAAGINLVEWDAVEIASQFMENWVLDPLAGYPLGAQLVEKARKARNFMAATACRRQLAFSTVDWLLHAGAISDSEAVVKLQKEVFARFSVPVIDGDLFLCSFSHIFGGGYAAGYYGYKWAEVMSCDLYGFFETCPREDIPELGMKLRKTLFSLGGSKNAYEVFALFAGRPPAIDAMLRQQGLSS